MAVPVVGARPCRSARELHHDARRQAHRVAARLRHQAPFAADDDGATERFRPAAPQVWIFLRHAAKHGLGRHERGSDVAIEPHRAPRSEQLEAIADADRACEPDLIDVGEPLPPIAVRTECAERPAATRQSFRRSTQTTEPVSPLNVGSAGRGVVSPWRTISSCVTAVWLVVVVVPCAAASDPQPRRQIAETQQGPAECTH